MYIFRYKVKAYSDENKNETKIYQGILLADCYQEAMEYLICQYGEEELRDILCLRVIGGDGGVIEIPDEGEFIIDKIDKIEENWIW